jgi:hypothetical protein
MHARVTCISQRTTILEQLILEGPFLLARKFLERPILKRSIQYNQS